MVQTGRIIGQNAADLIYESSTINAQDENKGPRRIRTTQLVWTTGTSRVLG